MHTLRNALDEDARTLLKIMGVASLATADAAAFIYQPIQGHPFGWLLHPGLSAGACAVTTSTIHALHTGGYLACDGDEMGDMPARCYLTDRGEACCSLLLMDTLSQTAVEMDSAADDALS